MIFAGAGRTIFYTLVVAAILTAILAVVSVQYLTYFLPENLPALTELSERLTADTWGVFDPVSGEILSGHNIDAERPIASITKLFTAEAVFASSKKEESSVIVYSDVTTEGRAGKLWYGDVMTPYELLFPLLLESSNDAAHAIRRILGPEYDSAVEETITSLSLMHTTITEPSGLSNDNVSSVRDIAAFYADLRQRHPLISDITELRMYIDTKTGYINNDPARALNSFTGGKHGFTDAAGRTFVGTFMLEGGEEVGLVLLGSEDLTRDIETLLSYAAELKAGSAIMTP